ncbi:PilZ domain-containing protein [Pseudomonas sp. Fl5BN2]|uniref:PilZ domain-containing protein n=1 Tax=unclassified Pseudomonas TaxID=196821 RepID=UPI001376A392|nr:MULTISPECIES: PilZ domain-containing protein [unclassified Pseudomonas]NBF03162.1 PilZ domain-containing protein [Pseudomonas sp. Fl5BN2]NBF11189.1 PilZ domain-containing protein [Pseudomonas sp. Fl4BN1]
MSEQYTNRRRFKRIAFDAKTELSQGPHRWPVRLLDLSLKGLLIERPDPWLGDPERAFEADIHLGPDADVHMDVRLAHDDHGQLGFVCLHIDLDSIEHLRRLIELNLGDPEELERELGALIEI